MTEQNKDSTRHHDPHWYTDETDAFPDYEPNRSNTTDYNFPEDWGMWSPEERADWFLEQRVRVQLKRQYDAGMWPQWDDSRLTDGMTLVEAYKKTEANPFRFK